MPKSSWRCWHSLSPEREKWGPLIPFISELLGSASHSGFVQKAQEKQTQQAAPTKHPGFTPKHGVHFEFQQKPQAKAGTHTQEQVKHSEEKNYTDN